METVNNICSVLFLILGFMMLHKNIYMVIGIFIKSQKVPETDIFHRYAIIIAARNEEAVIGNLIDSIHAQSYDQSKITVFVVADNCTDNTVSVCRNKNAVVYERNCPEKARKGYALTFLFEQIQRDYGIKTFDGYFIFDADNLLERDYIAEMNKKFAQGYEVITSYRNTKNFNTNFISAAYGIHFFRNTVTLHRPRTGMRIGTHLTGTGYLVANRLLEDGWKFNNLTEDDQFTCYLSAKQRVEVGYCDSAQFYDEQPTNFKSVLRQRIRWTKGRLNCFFQHGAGLFVGIFKYKSYACYDMFTHYFPFVYVSALLWIIYPLCAIVNNIFNYEKYDFNALPSIILIWLAGFYMQSFIIASVTVFRERKRINCKTPKLIYYLILFPWFDLLNMPLFFIAAFKRVRWLPIEHKDATRIEDIS